MALTNYTELKAAIANWAHRSDLTSYLDDLVTLAETRIMRDIRSTEMEAELSTTISAGVAQIPDGFLGLKNAYVDSANGVLQLSVVSAASLYAKYPMRSSHDMPTCIAVDARLFVFGPYPDSDYTIKGTYYTRLGPLSSSVHDLFTNHPDLYLFAALSETKAFEQVGQEVAHVGGQVSGHKIRGQQPIRQHEFRRRNGDESGMIIPLVGYAPDADPTARGVIIDCDHLVPTLRGMRGAYSPISTGIDALAAACLGAALLRKLDDSARFFAGTATKLYELSSTTWTDRSRSVGGAYAVGTTDRWRFAQFGDVSLAVAKDNTLQYSASGAFENVTGAPEAAGVETVGQFVFLWGTDDATFGDQPDRWWTCGIGDYTTWTPAIATQCVTGRLYQSPGRITGMRKFGDEIIGYKKNSMYRGQYIGSDIIWAFIQIPNSVAGALSHEAVVSVGTPENPRHLFMGENDFYSFDGSRPVPIGTNRVAQTVFAEINKSYAALTIGTHDPEQFTVTWRYCGGGSTTLNRGVVYNYKTDQWGRDDLSLEFAAEYTASNITYADVGTLYSTYGSMPSASYGSAFGQAVSSLPAIFNTSHVLQSLNGASTSSSMTTGDYGDDNIVSLVSRIRPRYLTSPTTAQMTNYYRLNMGDSLTVDQTVSIASNRFDILRCARWHRFKIDKTGPHEITAFDLQIAEDGDE